MHFLDDFEYGLLSVYIVQIPALFFMLQKKLFGYEIKKRDCVL
jgi:hypothetical protein